MCHSGFGTQRRHSKGSRPNGQSCWEIILSTPKLESQPRQRTRKSARPLPAKWHETPLKTWGRYVYTLPRSILKALKLCIHNPVYPGAFLFTSLTNLEGRDESGDDNHNIHCLSLGLCQECLLPRIYVYTRQVTTRSLDMA